MSVVYLPFGVPWQPVAEPEFKLDSWGIATASLLYRGPRPTLANFIAQITAFASMPNYSQMRLLEAQGSNVTASFPGVQATFVGFINGLPQAKGIPSLSAQTTRITGTDTSTGTKFSATVSYRAPRTSWEWWANSTPNALVPQYATLLNIQNPTNLINFTQVETADGNTTIPLSTYTAILNALVPQVTVSDYQFEPIVPNAIWRCSSVIDYKLASS